MKARETTVPPRCLRRVRLPMMALPHNSECMIQNHTILNGRDSTLYCTHIFRFHAHGYRFPQEQFAYPSSPRRARNPKEGTHLLTSCQCHALAGWGAASADRASPRAPAEPRRRDSCVRGGTGTRVARSIRSHVPTGPIRKAPNDLGPSSRQRHDTQSTTTLTK